MAFASLRIDVNVPKVTRGPYFRMQQAFYIATFNSGGGRYFPDPGGPYFRILKIHSYVKEIITNITIDSH